MGREPGLPPPCASAHGIQFCAPTHRVTVIPNFAQIGGNARVLTKELSSLSVVDLWLHGSR